MRMSAARPLASLVAFTGLVILLGLVVHAGYLARAGADAVYMDTLRLLWQWSEFRAGNLSLLQLWGQQGSPHSGLLFQALLAANAAWFGLDPLLANRATGFVIAAVATLLCAAYLSDACRVRASPHPRWPAVVVLLVTGLCFSLSGFELLTLDLGLGLWLKNLLVFTLFLAHAWTLRIDRGPGLGQVLLLSLYGTAVVVLCAMGWSYAMVGAILAVQSLHHLATRRRPKPTQLVLPLVLLFAMLAVTVGKRMVFGDGEESAAALRLDIPRQLLLSLASIFVNAEAAARLGLPAALLLLLGALLAVAFVITALVRVLDRRASLMPVHLIAYAVLCALSFVLARGAEGDQMVMASRYHMDLFPGLVGAVWILSMPVRGDFRPGRRVANALAGGLVLLAVGLQAGQFAVEWKTAPYRSAVFQAMNEALRHGVPDQAAADLLQAPLADARNAAAVMRRERLAVFRGAGAAPAGGPGACASGWQLGEGWYAPEAGGTWAAARAVFTVMACSCDYRLSLLLPHGHPERDVTIEGPGTAGTLLARRLHPGQAAEVVIPSSAQTERYVLRVSQTTVPAEAGINEDTRTLGVYMGSPLLACAAKR